MTAAIAPCAVAQARCACGAHTELSWNDRIQRSDGSWPACASDDVANHEDEDTPADSETNPRRPGDAHPHRPEDFHVTALYALALSADGSTLRSGPYRARLRLAVHWVQDQQDRHGRFGFSEHPDWMLDHALATTMLAEVTTRAGWHLLRPSVERALDALRDHLTRVGCADVELLVWTRMATAAARPLLDGMRRAQTIAERTAWDARLDALDAAVTRLAPNAMLAADPTDRRKLGAGVLLASFLTPEAERTPGVDVSWLDSYEHPLATTYYALACYRAGGTDWREMSARLKTHLMRTQIVVQPFHGSWDPRGAYGATYGRIGTTCASLLTLMFYYRYARLAAVEI